MGLLREVDPIGTEKNVKWFFKHEYKRLCRLAGSEITLTSPSLDGMPKAQAKGNHNEDMMIERANYSLLINTVVEALNACSVIDRKILLAKYVLKEPDWKIAQTIGYEKSSYYDMLRFACEDFADTLEYRTRKLQDDDLLEDLHSYATEKSEK